MQSLIDSMFFLLSIVHYISMTVYDLSYEKNIKYKKKEKNISLNLLHEHFLNSVVC